MLGHLSLYSDESNHKLHDMSVHWNIFTFQYLCNYFRIRNQVRLQKWPWTVPWCLISPSCCCATLFSSMALMWVQCFFIYLPFIHLDVLTSSFAACSGLQHRYEFRAYSLFLLCITFILPSNFWECPQRGWLSQKSLHFPLLKYYLAYSLKHSSITSSNHFHTCTPVPYLSPSNWSTFLIMIFIMISLSY